MSEVRVHQKAAKYLQRLPKDSQARIKEVLTGLQVNPVEHSVVKHMVGEWAGYHRYGLESFGSFFGLTKKRTLFTWITSEPGGTFTSNEFPLSHTRL